ncbi:hypothetical protein MHZ95_16605 [Sporosarcina sp. ACRSM]|uniref:hypothetical protein n=1 Tax=Sporosarcina sp. ACRSM TaxID=2918216 RepID=UPI001EF5949B|nr:hypothetical protein [Sporosarcina sp. ACRSM]MCG7336882.1 hypothetical protein [Sporosarcina sp. ACRSM]
MKRKNIVAFILILGCVSLLVINPFKKDIWDSNLVLLKNKILSEKEIDDKVNLSTFTPFEWDHVYSFNPYVPKESIYETIGYKWDNISETVSEGMNQIVFMKDGKVVCYLYGYPENNKFGFYFNGTDHTENASILRVEDHAIFDVKKNGDVVFLTHYQ